ncbi:MAG: acyl carrier protein [Anaerolineae bacterium]|nr:acyl carrier protein [Anaerolineae bacterium]MDW7992521.1 acyl carrier protein [Anaerolineae bacterium]MDW8069736.1 acyl carrier protein [Anaerolineae bacterium]
MSIKAQIRRYILENFLFTDDETRLRDDASFLEEGIVDSTGVLELVMFVEETFGIEVPDEDILPENFDSVERLTQYVETKIRECVLVRSEAVTVW